MDFEKAPPFKPCSTKQKAVMLRHVEGRLRSRSGALLEASPRDSWSIVEFMHRTVFEFLEKPEAWDIEPLRIRDACFNANASLLYLAMHLTYLSPNTASEDPKLSQAMILRVQEAVYQLGSTGHYKHWDEIGVKPSSCAVENGEDVLLLILAAEVGFLENIKRWTLARPISKRLKSLILCHLEIGFFLPKFILVPSVVGSYVEGLSLS
ncbi:hypothetical protein B0T14DRAFT_561891 [Immersiella caudata]|uniref:DUF7791 domain-containing protein n=1 Tax=Immersiella caudata TaxID=314043 RepID=A0AA39X276_9PEZI|nr:hypothetical protein B0T14DRAFT_561891 [Immersiella caudata]